MGRIQFRDWSISRSSRYRVNDDGTISELAGFSSSMTAQQQAFTPGYQNIARDANNAAKAFDAQAKDYPFTSLAEANNQANKIVREQTEKLKKQYESELSKERQYSALAQQIASLAGAAPVVPTQFPGGAPPLIPSNAAEAAALSAQIQSLAGPASLPAGTTQGLAAPLQAAQTVGVGGGPSNLPVPTFPQAQATDTGMVNRALQSLSAENLLGTSGLTSRLNFQVTDQQILDDYNRIKLNRLQTIVDQGNTQIAGITQRLNTANQLLAGIPANDPRRTASQVVIDQLRADLNSVTEAVRGASQQVSNFQPVTLNTQDGNRQVAGFRDFLKLPEERSLDQITQIDPDTVRSASLLGQRYRDMAMQDIPSTLDAATQADRRALQAGFARRAGEDYGSQVDPNTLAFRREVENQIRAKANENIPSFLDPQTEALRGQLEDETLNQLRLGTLLDADTQRSLQQATRGAQTARGNIFGVGPAAQEAMETGYAGEARAAQRRAAAQSFLGSGQTRSDASSLDRQLIEATRRNRLGDAYSFFSSGQSAEDVLGRDRQLRDQMNRQRGMDFANFLASGVTAEDAARNDLGFRNQLQLARMGAASNFIAAGPSLYNLSQARTAGQQNAFQNYINANQANPGQFNQAPSTAQPFYQTTDPNIPTALTQTAASIYNTMQNAQASMYGSQVGAIASSYRSPAQNFGAIAGGIGDIMGGFGRFFPRGF